MKDANSDKVEITHVEPESTIIVDGPQVRVLVRGSNLDRPLLEAHLMNRAGTAILPDKSTDNGRIVEIVQDSASPNELFFRIRAFGLETRANSEDHIVVVKASTEALEPGGDCSVTSLTCAKSPSALTLNR